MLRKETICDLCGKHMDDFGRSYRVKKKKPVVIVDWFESPWIDIDCHSECAELLYNVATRLEVLHGRLIEADNVRDYIIEVGQRDPQFRLGETIRYTPDEIQAIINKYAPTVIPANTFRFDEEGDGNVEL